MGFLDRFRRKNELVGTFEFPESVKRSSNREDRFLLGLAGAFANDGKGKQVTKSQKLSNRISPKQLELAARLDEIVFRCVNFYALQVVGPGFDLIGEKKATMICQNFFDKVDMMEKLEEVVRDMCITGNGWMEKMFDPKGKLVDLARIDPRFMDYKRDVNDFVKEDESGQIAGYVFENWLGEKKDLGIHQVIHFKLFGTGNELALGFVEPLYHLVYEKLNARKGWASEQSRNPVWVAKVGDRPDPNRGYRGKEATSAFNQSLADELEDMTARTRLVVPYWVDIQRIDPTKTIQPELTEFYNRGICAGFGIPFTIAMGYGKMERSNLEINMVRDLDRRIRSMQNKIISVIRHQLFPDLKRQSKFRDIPQMAPKEITPPDKNRMAKRYSDLVRFGVIPAEAVQDRIYKVEGLTPPKIKKEEKESKVKEVLKK